MGPGMDENEQELKKNLIYPHAHGVVLDLGAGQGITIKYLDRSRVKKYIALEPNMCMHAKIRETASAHGFAESDGNFIILSCSASDISSILFRLSTEKTEIGVDTIVSIRSACSFPSPQETLTSLARDVLKPGGEFLFLEHVLSGKKDVAWWQRFWSPIWEVFFAGCRLDRPTHLWIERMKDSDGQGNVVGMWSEGEMNPVYEDSEEQLFGHTTGRFVKHA
ncbi:hypothetical protein VKT23_010425 [Stygiomarasmius scandens]|uniref:S-adenosyl-L-methionine-dependent methyltransferase n=1 Tax=Marasmiellus scandens TaxID=2682957 RepID=A0ABR1JCL5_9AGAR